jgi:hypothetical protein
VINHSLSTRTENAPLQVHPNLFQDASVSSHPDSNKTPYVPSYGCLGSLSSAFYTDTEYSPYHTNAEIPIFNYTPLFCRSPSATYTLTSSSYLPKHSDFGTSSPSLESRFGFQSPGSTASQSWQTSVPGRHGAIAPKRQRHYNPIFEPLTKSSAQLKSTSPTQPIHEAIYPPSCAPILITRITPLLQCKIPTCMEGYARQKDLE